MLNDKELQEAFEDYTGHQLEFEDVRSWIAFEAFCAGYKLRDKEL